MTSVIRRAVTRLRVTFLPTEHDKEIRRWYSDDIDEERRYAYDLSSDSLVMDLGGYKGQWASDIYARYNSRILIFEPVKLFADKIAKRFARNPRVQVYHIALGANRRQDTITLSGDGSSVFRNGASREVIQVEDVVTFFAQHHIDSVDLVKINIEGGEYELVPRLIESRLIERVRHIQIQFHDLEPGSEARMKEIWGELSRTHEPTYRYKFVWESWTRLEN